MQAVEKEQFTVRRTEQIKSIQTCSTSMESPVSALPSRRHTAFVDGAVNEMADLPFDILLEAFLGHVEGRPDIEHKQLMEFSNRCGRIAWKGIAP